MESRYSCQFESFYSVFVYVKVIIQ